MSSESLISNFHFGTEDPIINKIQLLSPKRLGIFTESFLRKVRNLNKSEDNYHDAVDASGRKIEMKASRVLIDHHEESINGSLLDVLENDVRTISFFKEALDGDFICNIQQVKPECFDELNYLLLFRDCILEFRISSKTLLDTVENKKINSSIMRAVKKERNKHPELCRFLDEYLLDKQKLSDIAKVCANHHDKKAWKEINKAISDKRSINFSTKQHKGNKGEGQFHIKKTNLQYHIDNFLVAIYTYNDFKNILEQCEK
jgi:hypothetical protein